MIHSSAPAMQMFVIMLCVASCVAACTSTPPQVDDAEMSETTSDANAQDMLTDDASDASPDAVSDATLDAAPDLEPDEPDASMIARLPLVRVRSSGGLCSTGGCFRVVTVRRDGTVAITGDVYKERFDADARVVERDVPDSTFTAVQTALAAIDVPALEEGYGSCCNGHADGTDEYVVFFDGEGVEVREVRVSSRSDAPAELLGLMEVLWGLWGG